MDSCSSLRKREYKVSNLKISLSKWILSCSAHSNTEMGFSELNHLTFHMPQNPCRGLHGHQPSAIRPLLGASSLGALQSTFLLKYSHFIQTPYFCPSTKPGMTDQLSNTGTEPARHTRSEISVQTSSASAQSSSPRLFPQERNGNRDLYINLGANHKVL